MDRFSRIDFCVEGLSVERLLNHCAKQGIRLKNVRRRSLRAVAASATPQDFAALRTFAQERGWHIVQEKAAGVSKLRGVARGRALLVWRHSRFFGNLLGGIGMRLVYRCFRRGPV